MHRSQAAADVVRAIAGPHAPRHPGCPRARPAPVNVLADDVAQSRPMVSKHLRVLRDASIVGVRAEGEERAAEGRLPIRAGLGFGYEGHPRPGAVVRSA